MSPPEFVVAHAPDRARRKRPLSPHLQIWKWGPHMAVSIVHRATGTILALVGLPLLLWFLLAAAGSPDAFRVFHYLFLGAPAGTRGEAWQGVLHIIAVLVVVAVSWAWFQHVCSGLRHLVLDLGAGYELRTNKFWATMTFVGSVLLTAILWAVVLLGGAH